MKRFLSLILVVAFVLALSPMTVGAWWTQTFPEDENIAAQDFTPDTVIFSQTGGAGSPSSGGAGVWNRFYPSKRNDGVTDPTDSTNTVGRHFAGYNDGGEVALRKNVGIPTEGTFLWESNLMIAPPESGEYPQKIEVRFFNIVIATFTHTSGGSYSYTICGENRGTVQAGEWMRLTALIQCGSEGITAEDTVMYTTVILPDDSVIRQTYTGALEAQIIEYAITMGPDSVGGFYLDDVYLYRAGDFGSTTVITDTFEDDYKGNYPLDGKVTFTLYHRVDPARVDTTALKLYDEQGKLVPVTNITWKPTRPDVITLDFSGHPLSVNTLYTLVLPENTMDTAGGLIKENEISFRTNGNEGDWRERVELVKETAGGYVMPDPYNTGYRCAESELVDFFEKYPEFTSGSEIVITEEIARKYNYEFSHFSLSTSNIKVIATSPIYIHDARMYDGGVHNGRSGRAGESSRITVAWCEISGGGDTFGGKNITVSHCYVHDVMADHLKGNTGLIIEYNYFRDGGTRNPGAHADVVQFMGSTTEVLNDMRFYGNRFDVPHLGYDHVANCAFFFKPEGNTKGFSNVQAIGNWFNGGGFTMYITPAGGTYQMQYLTVQDNKIGCGYNFGVLNCNFDRETVGADVLVYEGNDMMSTLQAGSIVYYNTAGERVYDIAEMSGTGSVLVNLANYIAEARSYRIDIDVMDAEGRVIGHFTKDGEVHRYTPVKEYNTADNQEVIGTFTDNSGTHNVVQLKQLPDLPYDVPDELLLTGLPVNSENCRIEVTIYDTTADEDVVIRTGALADEVIENHRMPGVEYPTGNGYGYAEEIYAPDWSEYTLPGLTVSGGISCDKTVPAENVTFTEDGVLTLSHMARENIRITLTEKLSAGPARLAFDFRYDTAAKSDWKLIFGGREVFSVTPDGTVRIGNQTMQVSDGWNTAELIVLPYGTGGASVLDDATAIIRNDLYVRVTPQGSVMPTYGISEDALAEDYTVLPDFGTQCHLSTGVTIGYEQGEGSVTLTNLQAVNLMPQTELYEMTVKVDGTVQTVYMPADYTDKRYALPTTVDTWVKTDADTLILCGESIEIDGTPITVIGAERREMPFAGATASLDTEMTLNMKLSPAELSLNVTSLVVFAENAGLVWTDDAVLDDHGYYSIPLTGIRAACMSWQMELSVLAEESGRYYISASPTEYSLLQYIENLYENEQTPESVKQVLSAMLEYGAVAEEKLYGCNSIRRQAESLGITFSTALPEGYTSSEMTNADKTVINSVAKVGAVLTEGLIPIFDRKGEELTAIRVTCGTRSEIYYADESGRVTLDGLRATAILDVYTLDFLRADGTAIASAHFVIGNFLEVRRAIPEDTALAEATIRYMMQARAYALSFEQ